MKKLARLTAVVIVLLAFTSIAAAAAGPEPGPFSTTGYTTNLAPNPYPPEWGLPPLIPSEFEFLPNGYIKFHIRAQGEPGATNDAFCQDVYGASCQDVCTAPPPYGAGKACGTDGFFPAGSFTFDEWGLADATYTGYNHGLMNVTTDAGQAEVRFGGNADYFGVTGGFAFLDGTEDYRKLKGEGAYTGGAGNVFTVDYTPCGGKDQPACPADTCAVFGGDLKIKKDKIEWKIDNESAQDITASQVELVWPVTDGPITKVKLGGKTIYKGTLNPPAATIDLSTWDGKTKDLQIGAGKKDEKLEIEFAKGADIGANPWDYTFLVKFAEGCGVPFVAFAPAPAGN